MPFFIVTAVKTSNLAGRVLSSWMWCHVDLVKTDVKQEHVASIFRVERIHEQGAA
jgi:hypothetical protein